MSARGVRVGLLSTEPIRPAMGGIGVRYLELARRLPASGFDVALVSPGTREDAAGCGLDPGLVRPLGETTLRAALGDRDVVVAQGQLANDLVLGLPGTPTVIDLYDPWLIENLHYVASLGLDPWRNDHATWVLQLSGGDYFLCSSAEQRLYYLGFLTALGRVNPERLARDPTLEGLVGVVPFGLEPELPAHRVLLGDRRPAERRLLFGGLYDWYDPFTLLAALERFEDLDVTLLVVRNPNPGATPQALFARVEDDCRRRGWWGRRVVALDWVPAERRFDLLREVDALVATHVPGLETELAMRTRFLDALAAGCPAVSSAGGAVARLLEERHAGWVVPPRDPGALATALAEVLAGGPEVERRRARGLELARELSWERVLRPLVAFLSEPSRDATKERFAFRPATVAPRDGLGFRLRRRLARRSPD
ncbi:MAG: glycosyltransferase family 4 protein [Thermoanaerobaculia bacterium]|nr:MAG: glycosyltransferase family 4 protein [Thermoanaerobaculia bacterium]